MCKILFSILLCAATIPATAANLVPLVSASRKR